MLKYKRNRKLIQLTCDNCGKLYDKPITEYNRNIRLKRHNFCSRSCAINHNNPIYTASLDRIDSSKGYEIGNIQFISTAINYMKNTMSHEDTLKLCKIIAEKYSGDGGIR